MCGAVRSCVLCCFVVDANLPFVSEQFINNAIVMVVTLCIIASVLKGIRAAKRYISLMELWIVMWFYSS